MEKYIKKHFSLPRDDHTIFSGSSYEGVINNWSKSMYTKLRNYFDAFSTDPNLCSTIKLRVCS